MSCSGDSACSRRTMALGWYLVIWRTNSLPILPAAPLTRVILPLMIWRTLSVLILMVGRSSRSSTRIASMRPMCFAKSSVVVVVVVVVAQSVK